MRLLLVEDDELLGDALTIGLTQFGHAVDWLKDGEYARIALKNHNFDTIILDLGLPRLSGLDFLKQLRKNDNNTPVIILTARDTQHDKIQGLDSGADDYLTKPFDLNELNARIRALHRRAQGQTSPVFHYKDLTLNPIAYTATMNQQPLTFSRREFALLQKLLENVGQVVSRDTLIESLYRWDEDIDSNVLEVHVHNIRKKLNANYIRTIRGIGYMLEKIS